jgi:hypothetical protein
MDISFPHKKSTHDARTTSVAFPVLVNGHTRRCLVTEEALLDHFGANSMESSHLEQVFESHRDEIEAIAQQRFLSGATGDVFLRTQDFQD